MTEESAGKLNYEFADPEAGGGPRCSNEQYGFVPQIAGLFMRNLLVLHGLEGSNESVQISLPEELSGNSLRNNIEAALKRMAPGYLKTVAFVAPSFRSSKIFTYRHHRVSL